MAKLSQINLNFCKKEKNQKKESLKSKEKEYINTSIYIFRNINYVYIPITTLRYTTIPC